MKFMPRVHPLLRLCLSMVWVSVASEAAHFTDGRLSATGSYALMGLSAGLVLYCAISIVNRSACDLIRHYSPLLSAICCIAMLLPFAETLVSAVFGVSCGLFFAASLIDYLPHAGKRNRLLKIGFSAGIFTTAVYPFGAAYTFLAPLVTPFILRLAVFVPLVTLSVFIFFARADRPETKTGTPTTHERKDKRKTAYPASLSNLSKLSDREHNIRSANEYKIRVRLNPTVYVMVALVVALAVFNHLLNSGVLEQNGGTANAPLIFFLNVMLRLPMGLLMGYWADRGRWYFAVGFPLMMMIGGCAVSLFAGGVIGDFFMLSVFNCGGAAIVMLIHTLGMQTAIWRNRNAVAVCFGALTHFILVAFLNINTLGISPSHFGETLRQPLTLAVIVTGLPTFLLILRFLANEQLREIAQSFFDLHISTAELNTAPTADPSFSSGFSKVEKVIALMLIEGNSRRHISNKLDSTVDEINSHINAIIDKVNNAGEPFKEDFGLTLREAEVFKLILDIGTITEIASKLCLSEVTVKRHVSSILKKTKTRNRAELINRFGLTSDNRKTPRQPFLTGTE